MPDHLHVRIHREIFAHLKQLAVDTEVPFGAVVEDALACAMLHKLVERFGTPLKRGAEDLQQLKVALPHRMIHRLKEQATENSVSLSRYVEHALAYAVAEKPIQPRERALFGKGILSRRLAVEDANERSTGTRPAVDTPATAAEGPMRATKPREPKQHRETKSLRARIDPNLHRALTNLAIRNGKALGVIVEDALSFALNHKGCSFDDLGNGRLRDHFAVRLRSARAARR